MRWLARLFRRREPLLPVCRHCGGMTWHLGPQGGMSINLMCQHCERWVNWHQGIIPMEDLHQVGRDRQPAP